MNIVDPNFVLQDDFSHEAYYFAVQKVDYFSAWREK